MKSPMPEAEWRTCNEPQDMLPGLHGPKRKRKTLLFGCACCWLVWDLLTDERSREVVRTAERFADGEVSTSQFTNATMAAHKAIVDLQAIRVPKLNRAAHDVSIDVADAAWRLQASIGKTESYVSMSLVESRSSRVDPAKPKHPVHREQHVAFLRDIFGGPHTPIPSAWLTSDVLALARGIYDDKAFDRMPILADALQDAGCDNEDILSHCRTEPTHVRGCWVVDALLGKA